MKVNIKDVANKANVSIATVSRVLNNKPDVKDETKQKVLHIVKELGYQPNNNARGLVLNKTFTLGLIIPDIQNPFFPEIARGVEDCARRQGYSIIMCNTDNDKLEEKKAIQLMLSKQVDGLIVLLSMENRNILQELISKKIPVVQIDRIIDTDEAVSITVDNIQSAYQATSYLIGLGHQKICHITGSLNTKNAMDRIEGYRIALKQHGLIVSNELILEGDYEKVIDYQKLNGILRSKDRPTAIFAANDLMAIKLYKIIKETELMIPDDISIIGHDNINISSLVSPGLTTMNQPKYKMGKLASEFLIKEIENKPYRKKHILLNTNLIIRSSAKETSTDKIEVN